MRIIDMNCAKKIISAILTAAIITGALVGCKPTENTPVSSQGNSETSSTAEKPVENQKPEKVVIGLQQSQFVEDYETNLLTTRIEKDMGVAVDFIPLPTDSNDAKTKVSLLVTSGSALPDVFAMNFDDTVAFDYATKGIFVKLTKYFEDPKLAANFLKIPEAEREMMLSASRLTDGEIYAVPGYTPYAWNEAPYRFWANKTWLEKLKIDMPKTTDEFYEACKKMVNSDVNGNNKKDEIGVIGSKDGWAQKPFVYIMNAFTYANPDKQYFSVENGKVSPSFITNEWKAGLEFMNKMVAEGLFNPLSFTQDQTQLKAVLGMNEGGTAGFVAAGSYGTFNKVEPIKDSMVLMAPIAGPSGHKSTAHNPSVTSQQWWITKDCKNPEFAFQMADYFYDHKISMAMRYGEEEVEWSEDPEIVKNWVGDNEATMGIKATFALYNSIWNKPQNKMWGDIGPKYRSSETQMSLGVYDKTVGPPANRQPSFLKEFMDGYASVFPKEAIGKILFTQEEIEKIVNGKTAIDSYVYDTAVAFITGHKALTDWDAYLKELDAMGLTDYTNVMQAAYDRSKK